MIRPEDLIDLEQQFGGRERVPAKTFSPHDPRHPSSRRSCISGSRMGLPTYAMTYAKTLNKFNPENRPLVILELGILKGVGLAVWCSLFPTSRIIGLDVDVTHFLWNERNLRERGAFQLNQPEVFTYDELDSNNHERLAGILNGQLIDIVIDDALHDDMSIMIAMETLMQFVAPRFLYFVEDNDTVYAKIQDRYPSASVDRSWKLTTVSRWQ